MHKHARPLLAVLLCVVLISPVMPAGARPDPGNLRPCRDAPDAWCGSVERPLDPADVAYGTIDVAFELYRAVDAGGAWSEGTIVAIEGGPGYSTRASRDYYLELFQPLLETHDLLLMDSRGTGASGAIDCPELQSYEGDYLLNVALCGSQLGGASDLYGSAFAADDLAAILDTLGIPQIDLYGDSYGTFLAQTFALRHPDRLRTLTLDASYPVEDQDPWYRDLNRAMRDAIESVCVEDLECSQKPGDPLARVDALADSLRDNPISGVGRDGDGVRHDVTVDAGMLAYLYASAAYGTTVYKELEAAGEAWLDHGDPAPLLRIAAEQTYWGDAGPVDEFSEGLYIAVICNDYPQLWDIMSPVQTRPQQYEASVATLKATDSNAFSPFTVDDWLNSPWVEYESCINWPAPGNWVPPEPTPALYPDVPTLVLAAELDSLTSPEGNGIVAGNFPNSTFVEVANSGHVAALGDVVGCAAAIVVHFVENGSPGDTSCAAEYPPVRTTNEFPATLGDVSVPAGPASSLQRQTAMAVAGTVADLFPRWHAMYGYNGVGLRGGTFKTVGSDLVDFHLKKLNWVSDLSVSGKATWDRTSGSVVATVTFTGASSGNLDISWNEWVVGGQMTVSGTIAGSSVTMEMPAP